MEDERDDDYDAPDISGSSDNGDGCVALIVLLLFIASLFIFALS